MSRGGHNGPSRDESRNALFTRARRDCAIRPRKNPFFFSASYFLDEHSGGVCIKIDEQCSAPSSALSCSPLCILCESAYRDSRVQLVSHKNQVSRKIDRSAKRIRKLHVHLHALNVKTTNRPNDESIERVRERAAHHKIAPPLRPRNPAHAEIRRPASARNCSLDRVDV